ncbi:putative rnase p rpr2 rpp21 subunit [Diplodia seriata]|uniref:Putative rnase p rpr2 rpp21 subunit n=1 Tax=Diplodia seriata TaxID=420778 RepID=A0A0G2G9K4_9PEZI|nr:putative rnase p rpr2 rpp21 subunit [Diplodia seriata]
MAKGDASKPKSVPNKHLHARISYLYQAATYLANQSCQPAEQRNGKKIDVDATAEGDPVMQPVLPGQNAFPPGLPFYYASHLQSVSMKSQIRLSQDVKHSICKRCSAILVSGSTSSNKIENLSRGGKKPWADVLVIECNVCNAQKRFPVGAKRQPRKSERAKVEKARPASMGTGRNVTKTLEMENRTSITPLVEEIELGMPK